LTTGGLIRVRPRMSLVFPGFRGARLPDTPDF
jgi:hypothetical protein